MQIKPQGSQRHSTLINICNESFSGKLQFLYDKHIYIIYSLTAHISLLTILIMIKKV